jgi:DNA-binding NarL/FixJ family response regulator
VLAIRPDFCQYQELMAKISPEPAIRTRARLLMIDLTTISCEGIRAIVGRDGRFELTEYEHGQASAVKLLKRHKPDLLLIEPFAEGRDGVLLIKELVARFPRTRILAISLKPEQIYAERILRAGASGYWMKSGTSEELLCAIETILSGELYVSQRVAFLAVRKLVDVPRSNHTSIGGLTDRELHVFGLLGAGHGAGQIAGELGISRKTVETHQEHIKTKLSYRDARALHDGARRWHDSLEV